MIREAVMALAMQCVPPDTASLMTGISQHESGLNPLAIHDNTTRRSYSPTTEDEAVKTVTALVGAGHSVDAGLAQINDVNWQWTGLTAQSVFDPCQNLSAGLKVLLARYNGSLGNPAYPAAVLQVLNQAPPASTASAGEEKAVPTIEDRPADNDGEIFFGGKN